MYFYSALMSYNNQWYGDNRAQQSYVYSKPDKIIRNGNRSLQRNNITFNQPLLHRNGYGHLNQSVEGDILKINSRFSPTNNDRLADVKRTNSSIKINPEANDVVMPLANLTKNAKQTKAGRMWSTLNHFYKKNSPFIKKGKQQKQSSKVHIYSQENDYVHNEKSGDPKKKNSRKLNNKFLITSHPYMMDRGSFQSRCGSDLKFNWKLGMK